MHANPEGSRIAIHHFTEYLKQFPDDLEVAINRHGADTIAAFICEPIGGAADGAVVPPKEYFGRIRDICDRYDILLITDEVITGFGRTGANFAVDHFGVVPLTAGRQA